MRYVSKPQEVEAVQWTGENYDDVSAFGADVRLVDEALYLRAGKDGSQGPVPVPVGHWIVRSPGDFTDHWPVDPDYFAGKYEPLTPRVPVKKTPEEWAREKEIVIVDPDGWRSEGAPAWDEPITREEFLRRAVESTIREARGIDYT